MRLPSPLAWSFRCLLVVLAGSLYANPQTFAQTSVVRQRLSRTEAQVVYAGSDGTVGLDANVPLAVNSSGMMFTLDAMAGGVYRIKSGEPVKRIGRKGWGPGEFQEPVAIGWLHDTLWVSDKRSLRVNYFPAWGAGTPTSVAVSIVGTSEFLHTVPYALTPSGHAIVAGVAERPLVQASLVRTVPVWRTDRAGVPIIDTLARVNVRNAELIVRVRGSKAFYTVTQPMSDATLWNASRNGVYYVEVDRRSGNANVFDTPTVTLKQTDGREVFRVAVPGTQVALTEREYTAVLSRLVTRLNREGRRLGFGVVDEVRLKSDLFRPRFRVMATQVLVADNGSVLIRGPDFDQSDVEYTLLRSTGELAGTFRVPFNQRIRALVGDHIWSYIERSNGEIDIVRERLVAGI